MKKFLLSAMIAASCWLSVATGNASAQGCGLSGNCLPTGTANEVQATPTVTQGYPWVRGTIWCASPTVACQGSVTIEANICPTCPFTVMHSKTNPVIPDSLGRVCTVDAQGNYICDVFLDPTMYSYRCVLQNYGSGTNACYIAAFK